MTTNTQPADNVSASTDLPPNTHPVPQSWVEYGNTDYRASATPFFATTITHGPTPPTGAPLESDRYVRAGVLRVRFVSDPPLKRWACQWTPVQPDTGVSEDTDVSLTVIDPDFRAY